ncbi:MAG: hypothetical protein HRU17_08880 [Polyangiaceae bacterium]|nr:hypothetical protein [Polyangiaceae bacterium]
MNYRYITAAVLVAGTWLVCGAAAPPVNAEPPSNAQVQPSVSAQGAQSAVAPTEQSMSPAPQASEATGVDNNGYPVKRGPWRLFREADRSASPGRDTTARQTSVQKTTAAIR